MGTQKVWDVHFLNEMGIPYVETAGKWNRQRSGIAYHIFETKSEAEDYAAQYWRKSVILCREWSSEALASPFVHDHRKTEEEN